MERIRLRWIDPAVGNLCQRELTPPIRFGRDSTNDLVLRDSLVSRQHAILMHEDGRLLLVDLNSRNGTWLHGQRVIQYSLLPGEPFHIGSIAFQAEFVAPDHSTAQLSSIIDVPLLASSMICEQPQIFAHWGHGQITGLHVVPHERQLIVLTQFDLIQYDLRTQHEEILHFTALPIDRVSLDHTGLTALSLHDHGLYWWRSSSGDITTGNFNTVTVPDNTALSPDGRIMAVDQGEYVEIVSLPDGISRFQLTIDTANPRGSLIISANSRILAAIADSGVQLWDLESGQLFGHLPINTSMIGEMSFSPDQAFLAVICDSKIQIWDLWRSTIAIVIDPDCKPISRIIWSADGQLLAAVMGVRTIIYCFNQRDIVLSIVQREPTIDLAFLVSDGELACATGCAIEIYSLKSGAMISRISYEQQPITALSFTHQGQVLACAAKSVNLHQLRNNEGIQELITSGTPITAMTSTRLGDVLAIMTARSIELWQPQTGSLLRILDLGSAHPISIALDAYGQFITILTYQTISQWCIKSGDALTNIPLIAADRPEKAAITSQLFAIPSDNEIHIRRIIDGATVLTIPNISGINDVSLTNDNRLVALAQDDNVKVWSIANGQLLHTIQQGAERIAFDANGEGLILVGGDTIDLYLAGDGTHCVTLIERASPVSAIAFASTGDTLAAGLQDGTVRVWALTPSSRRAIAQ